MVRDGVKIVRFDGDEFMVELIYRPVPARLQPHIAGWLGVREQVGRPFERRNVPSATATIMFGLGEPGTPLSVNYTVGTRPPAASPPSLVIAMHQRAVMHSSRGMHMIQVELEPLAAYRLFGMPIKELAGEFVDLSDVLRGGDELVERLAEANGWRQRFNLLEAALARRLADGPVPNSAVDWAWRQIRRSGGLIGVAELAGEIGWSRRHLNRVFGAQVGMPPKAVARLRRLQTVVERICAPQPRSLADIAVECGYYDHAHLDLDFRDILGCTPTQLLEEYTCGRVRNGE